MRNGPNQNLAYWGVAVGVYGGSGVDVSGLLTTGSEVVAGVVGEVEATTLAVSEGTCVDDCTFAPGPSFLRGLGGCLAGSFVSPSGGGCRTRHGLPLFQAVGDSQGFR